MNIFLFENLKRQDFLNPNFSDTCIWVQDPSKWMKKNNFESETDDVVLNRREKQISLGKGTEHYRKYTELVEIADRDNKMPR